MPFVHNYQCQAISEKTAMPMTADLSDESLLFQTVRDVTVVLFSRLLSTDFLQHNCSTKGREFSHVIFPREIEPNNYHIKTFRSFSLIYCILLQFKFTYL